MSTPAPSRATIRPYINPESTNMGLEKYKLAVYDDIFHEESLTCLDVLGQDRYVTGLDEFAASVQNIQDVELREAKIKEIKTTIAYLEPRLGGKQLNPEDADFWNKVVILKPDNHNFWKGINVVCGNNPTELQPATDIKDLLKILAIKAGGFSIVAPSLEAARAMNRPPKFFLDEAMTTLSLTTEVKKLRNRAGAELDRLFERDRTKLLYVAKTIDANSLQYRKGTNPDVMYDNMDLFLDGKLDGNLNKATNINKFLKVVGSDTQTLKIQAVVKDANLLKYIARRSDGAIYEMSTGNLLGRNIEEVVEFLKNPLNETTLESLLTRVEANWK